MDNIIQISNLTKEVSNRRGTTEILKGIDLQVMRGEFLAIMGASGSGKSTLLSLIAGIDQPTKGEIVVQGKDICQYNERELANYRNTNVGIVFQNFNLITDLNAIENVMVPIFFRNEDLDFSERAKELIEIVGMKGKENLKTKQMSGGEQQRIAIARALVCNPAIFLADEPTGALDSRTGEQIIGLFLDTMEKIGTTVIMVTHEKSIAEKADRIVTMKDGLLV